MKKLLIIVSGLNKGGTESFLFEYYKYLINNPLDISILSFSDNDPEVVHRFQDKGFKIIYGQKPILRSFKRFKNDFINLIKKEKFDIIHCNCNSDNAFYLYYAYKCGVPIRIGHYHDTLTNVKLGLRQKISYTFKRYYCKKYATKSFGCSKEALKDILGDINNGVVIENIVDSDDLRDIDSRQLEEIKKTYNLKGYKYIFGNISRFEEKKNQRFILDIFKDFLNKEPLSLLVLGGTGDCSEIKSLAEKYKIKDNVLFIGPRSDVKYWYNIFTLYLMPSLFEGFGISAVEAQCSGCFVIASDFLPKTTDYGNIKYLPLEKQIWVEELHKKHIAHPVSYDKRERIASFLHELVDIK
jgi:glycosyltransferase involved in cell wall biosynthesis